MPIERITIKLPDGFDISKHLGSLRKMIGEKQGYDFEIESIDPERRTATATRQVLVTETTSSAETPDTIAVQLPKGTKPADGDRISTRLSDQYGDGYEMTVFEPFLGKATMSKLTPNVARCRGAVAVALGVKPWEIQVIGRADGGFDVNLPANYVPSKHDKKLDEVATSVVGGDGWYVDTDPATLSASINPGEPPTFPNIVSYPFDNVVLDDWSRIPIGMILPRTGGEQGNTLYTDWAANPHMLISGTTGGGKGVTATAILSGALAAGWEVAIVDGVKGGVDFVDFEDLVMDGGWGDDLTSACRVIESTYAEGLRRKSIIKQNRVKKWTELKNESIKPILILVDEFTSLIAAEPVPKGVPKDHPLVLEASERNLSRAKILSTTGKIARELRFTGVSMLICTQAASTATGVPTELRQNLSAKILLGPKPTDNNRRLALDNPLSVPFVPPNVIADPRASAGVGVFEFQGAPPGVVKTFFAETTEFAKWLKSRR